MRNIACFDIGGTFIKYGVVNEQGEILFKNKFSSPRENCKETIPENIVKHIKELQKDYEISAVGISTAGQVDSLKGEIIFASDNLPGYTGAKLSADIKRNTGLDCFVENDVNAAALGELWKGAAKGWDSFICVTLGTGIGGAIIINGKLFKGMSGGAGEVGHMIIKKDGESCGCGRKGCYERYASTSALIRNYKSAAIEGGFGDIDINGEEIVERVKRGEALALKVYDEFLDSVTTGMVNIAHIFDPGLIVVGGGISAQGEEFFRELNKRFSKAAMPSYAKCNKIVQAELQNDAGILGACYLTLQK